LAGHHDRQRSLDGLRGVAALSVFVHHVWSHQLGSTAVPTAADFWGFIGEELRLGVILFFVLSGFLLYRGFVRHLRADSRPDLARYLKRRAARILPAYYVALAGSFLLLWGSGVPGLGLPPAHELPLFAVFGQNYSASSFLTLDSPTWTLCIEVGFYVLLPLLVVALLRIRAGWRFQAGVIAAMVAAGLAWRAAVLALGAGPIWDNMLPAWLPYFAFGMAVALWVEHAEPERLPALQTAAWALGGGALIAANGVFGVTEAGTPGSHLVGDLPAGVGFAVLTALALIGTGPAAAWMRLRWLIAVGVVSYGFYLWHLPLLFFLRGIHPEGGFLATLGFALPLALVAATLSWVLIERPAMRMSRIR
jgi:peptidoglycan/LPS O-acetylase OafA/YrhL